MREPSAAPAEYVSYVDRRLGSLEAAGLRLTGDEVQSERIARDLLTLVALRWRWLTRLDARRGQAVGTSADAYLARLFQQEADEFGYPRMILSLDAGIAHKRRSTMMGVLSAADEAEFLWDSARQRMRRRLLIGAVAGGVIAVAAVCSRGGSPARPQQLPQVIPSLVRSTDLPEGALVVLSDEFEPRQTFFPAELRFPTARPKALSSEPLPRAVLLAGSPTLDEGRVYALADNGSWRHLDTAPERAGAWMSAAALSPDGRQAAFATPTTTVIVDLTTGEAKTIPWIVRAATSPVWLSEQQLLLARDALFDVPTWQFGGRAPVGPEDTVTPRRREPGDRTAVLNELLSPGQPLTAPARVRQWQLDLTDQQPVTRPLAGRLADLVGRWQGNGFGYGDDRMARMCTPDNLPTRGQANAAIAVIMPKTAEVVRVLLLDTAKSGVPGLLGWQDERRVLFTLAKGGSGGNQRILAWDPLNDRLTQASTLDFAGTLAMRDLSRAA